jgi:hypothetical protein
MKHVSLIRRGGETHWVGDGLPARTAFFYADLGPALSPFLLLDHIGPHHFPPTEQKLGVGAHPHRGFETVTLVYSGELAHRDSAGGGGIIGQGDVQWMTAASGIVHEEFHSADFARRGGLLEAVQLWVNLPAGHKMAPPAYQAITSAQIPAVDLPDGAGTVRVIAGSLKGIEGPARTFTPVNLRDYRLKGGTITLIEVPNGTTTVLFLLAGKLRLGSGEILSGADLVLLSREGSAIGVEAIEDTMLLFLNGEPIPEPIAGHGPFVMNTESEVRQAYADYQAGRLGHIAAHA